MCVCVCVWLGKLSEPKSWIKGIWLNKCCTSQHCVYDVTWRLSHVAMPAIYCWGNFRLSGTVLVPSGWLENESVEWGWKEEKKRIITRYTADAGSTNYWIIVTSRLPSTIKLARNIINQMKYKNHTKTKILPLLGARHRMWKMSKHGSFNSFSH